jgi:predicted RNA-binding Zn ribbon-like protein
MPVEPPNAPFPSGRPYWYWLGGRPALDLVNTKRERWRHDIECLCSPDDLSAWLQCAKLTSVPATAGREDLAGAVWLREAIDACVRAAVSGESPAAESLAVIDGWLEHAVTRPSLVPDADGAPALVTRPARDPIAAALGAVALDAARLLGRPHERARLRICGSDTCSARFFDRSPAARRRWCSMAGCGNVAKARRHRARAGA